MKLLNTITLPSQFAAQGINHVAVYQDGIISKYLKNKSNSNLTLTVPTTQVSDVHQIRISPSGEYIAVQTKTKTVRVRDGVQETFDNNIGAFSIADTGQIVMVALASGAVQVIDSSVTNLTVAVTDDDRVVCAAGRYMIYNRARTITSAYSNLVLTPVASAKEIVYVSHDHNGKFVVFYADGTYSYDGAAAKTLPSPMQGFRDVGDQILGTDMKNDYTINHYHPTAFPELVRPFKWTLPPTTNTDYADLLLMAPGSGVTTADFDLKKGLAISSITAVTSVADSPYGAAGKSLLFDSASSSSLQTDDSANIQLGANDFTIELFVKINNAPSGTCVLFNKGGTASGTATSAIMLSATASKTFQFLASMDGTSYAVNLSNWGAWETDKWTHVAITRKGNVWRCFQNGKLSAKATAAGTVFAHSGKGLQIGHWRFDPYATGAKTFLLGGNINGFQILNYAKYVHDFYPETISITPSEPPFPLTGTLLDSGPTDVPYTGFMQPQFMARGRRALMPSLAKVRVMEPDLTITEYTRPADASPYIAQSMVDDKFISLHAMGSKAYLSINGGVSYAETAPANTYNTGMLFKFKGYIWMLYANYVRRYSLDMSTYALLSRYTANVVQAYDFWDYNTNAIVSTTSTSVTGGNLYVSWGDPTTFTGYAMGLTTNLQVSYVGNNVFYVRPKNAATGVSKLIYVPVAQGTPILLADLPKVYDEIMHLGTRMVILDDGTFFVSEIGADNPSATQAQAQVYVNAITATIGQNPKAYLSGGNYAWAMQWPQQKRMLVGTDTAYQVWQF
jgi:hypothetical protein